MHGGGGRESLSPFLKPSVSAGFVTNQKTVDFNRRKAGGKKRGSFVLGGVVCVFFLFFLFFCVFFVFVSSYARKELFAFLCPLPPAMRKVAVFPGHKKKKGKGKKGRLFAMPFAEVTFSYRWYTIDKRGGGEKKKEKKIPPMRSTSRIQHQQTKKKKKKDHDH